jgi:hypothetical protein
MIIDNLLQDLKIKFDLIKDGRSKVNTKYSLGDLLMSAFAMFSLKDSSLLQYIHHYKERAANLRQVYGITQCPSDSCMRGVLDELKPTELKELPGQYIQILERENYLIPFELKIRHLGKCLYIPIDGTKYFTSKKIHCPHCQTQRHQNGTITYSHGALAAIIAHPDKPIVLPLAMEDIQIQDGASKNDHELCAAKRLLPMIAQSIGSYKALIGGDALYSNAPFIRFIHTFHFNFLFNIKEGNQSAPFIQFKQLSQEKKTTCLSKIDAHFSYFYEFANQLFLNKENQDIKVNFLKLTVVNLQTRERITFCWITDIHLNETNCAFLAQIGRTRWKIENETFNTLKNQNYDFEHNFGHGNSFLAQNFAQLMFLAFSFDQINYLLDDLAKRATIQCKSVKKLCADIRKYFDIVPVQTFEQIFKIITREIKLSVQMEI